MMAFGHLNLTSEPSFLVESAKFEMSFSFRSAPRRLKPSKDDTVGVALTVAFLGAMLSQALKAHGCRVCKRGANFG